MIEACKADLMPQSFATLYTHLVFSTKDRRPLIEPHLKDELHSYMAVVLQNMDCHAIIINSMPDHIHILLNLSRTVTVAKAAETVKANSSKWLKTKTNSWLGWQSGYGAFSVSNSRLGAVSKYIRNQEKHHAKASFKEEFIKFLDENGIDYDEHYLWD